MIRARLVTAAFLVVAAGFAGSAQQQQQQQQQQHYAKRSDGDVVHLEDSRNQTVVSVIPSVGNIAFELKVKGTNVLRWPYASVADFKARPALSAIPFLAPWANRLDEQAFYANGTRYAFDMALG